MQKNVDMVKSVYYTEYMIRADLFIFCKNNIRKADDKKIHGVSVMS